ncbi:hypothetical protein DQ04_04221020 [Trypanosoma grayi]|uniref:hypothetical protein n=1 Tax=Trypanosoma grayi TaxID=71804 RepID=UPI0004F3FEDC|nr:hypothetical protein DQ04_04221020 [Trypanosoma grayi]KEG10070.1 hypothetical protein DQ04_04221020 [Trypanosoma grayi]
MRRFALVTHKVIAGTSHSHGVLMSTAAVAATPVMCGPAAATSPAAKTADEPSTVAATLSVRLTSMVADLQRRSKDAAKCDGVTLAANAGDAPSEHDVCGKQTTTPTFPMTLQPVQLIDALSLYIRREEQLNELCRSKLLSVRRYYVRMREQKTHLSPLEWDVLLNEATNIVEGRGVPLAVAARLLRPRWPEHLMDVSGSRHHAFLVKSVLAWVTSLLQEGKLTAPDARTILVQCPRLFTGHVALMGSVVECALSDIKTLDDPEVLIQLMWAVNDARTHAPDHFWRRVLDKLAQLNRSLRDQVGDAIDVDGRVAGGNGAKKTMTSTRTRVGHVFSGLTTRQLFRALRVLRKERWCGDVPTVFDFVDRALKNIAFEAEAMNAAVPKTPERQLSRQAVVRRVQKASDLSPAELLSLLNIAGELGVQFHVSLVRVAECLLAPMVQYLNREQLMLLTSSVRRTRCDSPQLVQAIMDAIVRRGVTYPCALSLSKATLRTVLQKPALLSQLTLAPFVEHITNLCNTYRWSMRASQVLGWVELLYALSRRYAPSSSVGVRVRMCVEGFAAPLSAMMALGVVPTSIVSRMLEHTVILGMRQQPQYPLTAKLREERNVLVNARNAQGDDMFDDEADVPLQGNAATSTSTTTNVPDSSAADMAARNAGNDRDPRVGEAPRAVRQVYDYLIFAYERQMILRVPLANLEEQHFCETFRRVGLYNIFTGASIMKQVHLRHTAADDGTLTLPPNAQSAWVEKHVGAIIDARLQRAKISPTSSNDDVLRLLGQRHCDAAKVRKFQELVQNSPLLLARQQRRLWEYISELARRFGGQQERDVAQKMLATVLY